MISRNDLILILLLILIINSTNITATNHLTKSYSEMTQEERKEFLNNLGFILFNGKNPNGITPDDVELSNDGNIITITKIGHVKSQKAPIDLSNLKGEKVIKVPEGAKLKDKSGNEFNFGKGSSDIKIINGKVIIKNAILTEGSIIDGNKIKGNVESYDDKTKTLISQQGKGIVFNGREYSPHSVGKVMIKSNPDSFTISGQSVIVKDSNKMLFEFSGNQEFKKSANGQVTIHKDGYITIGQGTKYLEYDNGQKSVEYRVSKDTHLYSEKGRCDGSSNCIEKDKSGEFKIVAKSGNDIQAQALDDSIKQVRVSEITDTSKVTFSKNGVDVVYSKDPLLIKGNPLLTRISFSTIYKGNEYSFDYNTGLRTGKKIPEQQFINDLKYLLDQGYTIHDIARGVWHRDWFIEKGGRIGKGDHAIFVWDGPEGNRYLELQDQLKNLLPPYVDIDGKTVQINHAFAGIVAATNTPSVLAPFKVYGFTTYGDNYQVFSARSHAFFRYYWSGSIGTLLTPFSEKVRREQQYYTREDYELRLKYAESFYPESQYRGNVIGRQIATEVRDKSNDEIVTLFRQKFDQIKKESTK